MANEDNLRTGKKEFQVTLKVDQKAQRIEQQ